MIEFRGGRKSCASPISRCFNFADLTAPLVTFEDFNRIDWLVGNAVIPCPFSMFAVSVISKSLPILANRSGSHRDRTQIESTRTEVLSPTTYEESVPAAATHSGLSSRNRRARRRAKYSVPLNLNAAGSAAGPRLYFADWPPARG